MLKINLGVVFSEKQKIKVDVKVKPGILDARLISIFGRILILCKLNCFVLDQKKNYVF